MPIRKICRTKTGKVRRMKKNGRCPKGSTLKKLRVKKGRKRRSRR